MQNGSLAIMQAANLYVYTMNNPVRWVDPSGKVAITAGLATLFGIFAAPVIVPAVVNLAEAVSMGLSSIASTVSSIFASDPAPTPAPPPAQQAPPQVVAGAGAGAAGATAVIPMPAPPDDIGNSWMWGTAATLAPALSSPISRAQAIELEREKRQRGQTPIFRSGSGNATNMTIRPWPQDPGGALSFYLTPPPGIFTMTTMEMVNATGVFTAVRDGVNHVSVRPIDITRTQEWRDSRATALTNPHPFTRVMMSITIRVR